MVNWFLLAQPSPIPEEILTSNPDRYLTSILESWGGDGAIESDVVQEYARCFRNPRVIRAICAEYRAGDSIDLDLDRAGREAGRRLRCPVLVVWAPDGLVPLFRDPLAIWRAWAPDVEGGEMSSTGPFIMEESPDETTSRIERFLRGVTWRMPT